MFSTKGFLFIGHRKLVLSGVTEDYCVPLKLRLFPFNSILWSYGKRTLKDLEQRREPWRDEG